MTLPRHLKFEWLSVTANEEAVVILATVAAMRRQELVGTIADMEVWFRQHALARAERWKAHLQWQGKIYLDTGVQMGRSSAAQTCQRTSFLLVEPARRKAMQQKAGQGIVEQDETL